MPTLTLPVTRRLQRSPTARAAQPALRSTAGRNQRGSAARQASPPDDQAPREAAAAPSQRRRGSGCSWVPR
eukprot:364979-Chlamydomonas_euryale.AAC.2